MAGEDLRVVVMAGPNGSGKTSLIEDLLEAGAAMTPPIEMPANIINPDLIRQSPDILKLEGTGADLDAAAQKAAYLMRRRFMDAQQPFAFETVMSHPSRLTELQQLRDHGYSVYLTFITTKSPDINVERVKFRVQSGTTTGHDVPEQRVRDRYARTLHLLPAAIELADHALLFDNSYAMQPRTQQAWISRLEDGYSVVPAAAMESWAHDTLGRLLARDQERQAAVELASGLNASSAFSNGVAGVHMGELHPVGAEYFAILEGAGTDAAHVSIHDRSMFMPTQAQQIDRALSQALGRPLAVSLTYIAGNEPQFSTLPAVRAVDAPNPPASPRSSSRPRG